MDEAQDENIDVNAIVGDRGRRVRSKTGMSAGGALGSLVFAFIRKGDDARNFGSFH